LGTLDREGLKKEYSRHQFYFQGSQVEGLPNVLCEAMLCECIPLGNSVFGIPDAIGATGHIFEGAKALASVIEFVEGIKNTTELGEKARERIKNHYPISRRAEAFEKPLNLTEDEN
jgi:glycosyltransferase involved in cell wall biosynthesis